MKQRGLWGKTLSSLVNILGLEIHVDVWSSSRNTLLQNSIPELKTKNWESSNFCTFLQGNFSLLIVVSIHQDH